ncbi:MAG TPA: T9SS type A sorting domain-containing protein [Ignavibacteria bacterium]|nr:T9SS type A sorting domain-containing protein [Ignavibacteria bacterium]
MKYTIQILFFIVLFRGVTFSQPVIQWEREYNGSGNNIDKVISIKSDPLSAGNIYVCGFVTNSGTGMDIVTIKYNSSGTVLWSVTFNGAGNSTDYPADLYIANSYVYMCGTSIGSTGNYDIIYQVYNYSTGAVAWSGSYNGTANLNDYATSISADAGGTRFVSGISTNSSGNTDAVLFGYGTFGGPVIYNGSANMNELGSFMKFRNIGVSGDLVLTGSTEISALEKQIFIRVYNSNTGSLLWSKTESIGNGVNDVSGVEVQKSVNYIVYGTCSVSPSPSVIFAKQFSIAGVSGLSYLHSHQTDLNDRAVNMKIDTAGNSYLTGSTFRNSSNDYITFKLNSSFNLQWSNYYNGPSSGSDIPGSVTVDKSFNTIVTGTSEGSGTGSDIATIWYDVNGNERWSSRFNGTSNSEDGGTGALLLNSGQFAVCGISTSPGTGADMKLIKYSDAALPVTMTDFSATVNRRNVCLSWQTSNEINNSGFELQRISVKSGSSSAWEKIAFITGHGNTNIPSQYTFSDINLNAGNYNYRLKQIDYNGNFEYFQLNAPREIVIGAPQEFELSQNYPNPSNPTCVINYSVPSDGYVKITVYDIQGKVCAILIDEQITAGYHSVRFDGTLLASGIYFYRIQAESFTETKKMILIK